MAHDLGAVTSAFNLIWSHTLSHLAFFIFLEYRKIDEGAKIGPEMRGSRKVRMERWPRIVWVERR